MTREEAIKKIKKVIEESVIFEDELEAFDIAIKALSRSENPNTCGDAISREPFTDSTICEGLSCNECSFNRKDKGGCILEERVMKLPSVTPQQRTGRWILTDDDFVYCSECEDSYYPRPIDASWYYCPHCGAKMEVEE